ncbi:MAG: LptA/OstA family protein [Paracoccaceae bacterium]|nr:LptA/OstA family protein [Paracoccaceae bacterium]
MRLIPGVVSALVLSFSAGFAVGQGATVPFGNIQQDSSIPIEIAADQLNIDQEDGAAIFTGNVTIGQGEMRLSAQEVRVEYAAEGTGTGNIARLLATGGVVLVTGTEAAEAQDAVYSVQDGMIILTGNVLLTQGRNALSAQKMTLDLSTGNARLEGGVKTILQSGGN